MPSHCVCVVACLCEVALQLCPLFCLSCCRSLWHAALQRARLACMYPLVLRFGLHRHSDANVALPWPNVAVICPRVGGMRLHGCVCVHKLDWHVALSPSCTPALLQCVWHIALSICIVHQNFACCIGVVPLMWQWCRAQKCRMFAFGFAFPIGRWILSSICPRVWQAHVLC